MRAKFTLAFVLLAMIGLYRCAAPPTVVISAPESKAKKLVYFGWGSPDTPYVREHWSQMEEMPFDGVGIIVPVDRRAWQQGKRDTHNQLAWQIMGKKTFRTEDFRGARSCSFLRPVSRFHSSKVSLEIFPSTSSCANFRR